MGMFYLNNQSLLQNLRSQLPWGGGIFIVILFTVHFPHSFLYRVEHMNSLIICGNLDISIWLITKHYVVDIWLYPFSCIFKVTSSEYLLLPLMFMFSRFRRHVCGDPLHLEQHKTVLENVKLGETPWLLSIRFALSSHCLLQWLRTLNIWVQNKYHLNISQCHWKLNTEQSYLTQSVQLE